MTARPLRAVGVVLIVLAVALLTWVMQRDGESLSAGASSAASTPAPPSASGTASVRPTATSGQVLRIRIPDIGLDLPMRAGGLSSNGTIDPDPGTVMWFQGHDRVRPGSVGTAVIAAHVATGQRADVFADLADVEVGDTVEVLEDGRPVTYRVARASAIDKLEVTTDQTVWGANDSRTRLAIITCDDAYGLRGDGHRVANFVVIADKV
jgi:LPXTG-site transpeptidase (sortase) family protein